MASSSDGNTLVVAAPIGDGMAILSLGGACNDADLAEPYGELNFFDVSEFLARYNASDLGADFNGDGELNFFDVSAFLSLYKAGCP